MPRTISPVCSGICLLLTTALFGQAPLSRNPSLQQVVGYTLRQQQEWQHRQLPPNSVLFKHNPNYTATHTFLHSRSLENGPVNSTPYGFSIKQAYPLYPNYRAALQGEQPFSPLQLYLYRERLHYSSWRASRQWYEPAHAIGAEILRDLIIPPPQKVFQR